MSKEQNRIKRKMSSRCRWNWCRKWFRAPAKKCPEDYMQELKNSTILTTGQIQHLYERFCFISDTKEGDPPRHLFKRNFLSIAHFQNNPLMVTILTSMFGEKKVLGFVEFATYLSVFQASNLSTRREQIQNATKKKLRLLFNMFDTNKDGCITEDDLINILHKLYRDILPKAQILNIVEIMMFEMDTSHTHQILFDDFSEALAVFDMDVQLVTRIPEV